VVDNKSVDIVVDDKSVDIVVDDKSVDVVDNKSVDNDVNTNKEDTISFDSYLTNTLSFDHVQNTTGIVYIDYKSSNDLLEPCVITTKLCESDKYKWCLEEMAKHPLESDSTSLYQDQSNAPVCKNTSKSMKTYMRYIFGTYCGLALCTFLFKTLANANTIANVNAQQSISAELSSYDYTSTIAQVVVASSSDFNRLNFQSVPITSIGHRAVDSLAFPKSLGEYVVSIIGNLLYKSNN
jgi:hypothetical protein